jgi:hypothetical protein
MNYTFAEIEEMLDNVNIRGIDKPITHTQKNKIIEFLHTYAPNGNRLYNMKTDLDSRLKTYEHNPGYKGLNFPLNNIIKPKLPNDLFKSGHAIIEDLESPYMLNNRAWDAAIPVSKDSIIEFNAGNPMIQNNFIQMPILLYKLPFSCEYMRKPGKILYFQLRPIDKLMILLNTCYAITYHPSTNCVYSNGVLGNI